MTWYNDWEIQRKIVYGIILLIIFVQGFTAFTALSKKKVDTGSIYGSVHLEGSDAFWAGVTNLIITIVFVIGLFYLVNKWGL